MQGKQIEKAILDPVAIFGKPEDVASEPSLTKAQKIEILRRWEHQAADEAVALEEGMQGDESDLLRRIFLLLDELVGPLDLEHTPPTKQGGLTRESVKKTS
jgi:hypothetical protein